MTNVDLLPECCKTGVLGSGSYTHKSKIAIVGIAPGENEWKEHRPFMGQSGKVLNALLQGFELKREDIFTTNCHCHVNNKPTRFELDSCRPRLIDELKPAKLIIAMGEIACNELFTVPFSRARGAVLYDSLKPGVGAGAGVDGTVGLVTYHPSAMLQAGDKPDVQNQIASDLYRDFETLSFVLASKTRRAVRGALPFTVIKDSKVAQALLDSIESNSLVVLDIETNYDKDENQSIFDQKILCIGVGIADSIYVLAADGLNVTWPSNVRYCFHNGSFDTIGMWLRYGQHLSISEDTLVQSYTLDERNRKGLHALKPLARCYAGSDFYEETEHKDEGDALYEYNAKDISNTAYLVDFFKPLQDRDETRGLYESLLIPGTNMLAEAQYYGIPVDKLALAEETIELGQALIESKKKLRDLAGRDINLNSSQQLAVLLYEDFGLNITKRSKKTGAPSTDKEAISELVHPFVDELLHERMLDRLFNGYLAKAFTLLKIDGKLHPIGSACKTTSGRLAYSDPPIQTLPKAHTVGAFERIRRIFATESDEYVLVEADYSQIELVIAQALSHDEQMGVDLASGDMHGAAAQDFFHAINPGHDKDCSCSPACIAWNYARYSAKHYNFGSLFEESASGYTRKPPLGIGCTLQEAVRISNEWKRRYHQTVSWKEMIKLLIKTQGYITTPFGRRRRMPMVLNTRQLRQIVNAPVQGTASDCTLSAAIELWPLLKKLDSRILFLVHDSIVFHVRRIHLDAVLNLINEIMTKPRHELLPGIKIEVSQGPNLYDMKKVKA